MTDPIPKSYIPFDVGIWKSAEGLECAKHGLQYGGLALYIQSDPYGESTEKRYCSECILELVAAAEF